MTKDYLEFTGERIIPELENYFFSEHIARYRLVNNYLDSNMSLLDVGCGDGYGTYYLSQKAKNVIGIDISNKVVSLANRKYKRDNLSFMCVDNENWQFVDVKFDLVTCFEVFEHIYDPEALLVKINNSVESDGTLIISTPNKDVFGENLKIEFHVKEYTLNEFIHLLNKYFDVSEVYGQFNDNKLSKKWNFWVSKQAMRFPWLLKLVNWSISKRPKKYLAMGYFDTINLKGIYFSKNNAENADYFVAICKKKQWDPARQEQTRS